MTSKTTFWKYAKLAERTIACVAIVCACAWTWSTYCRLLSAGQAQPKQQIPMFEHDQGLEKWRSLIEGQGAWVVSKAGCEIRVTSLTTSDPQNEMSELPSGDTASDSGASRDVVAVIKGFMQVAKSVERKTLYVLNSEPIRLAAWVDNSSGTDVVSIFRAAVLCDGPGWVMAEIRFPTDTGTDCLRSASPQLLPLPAESQLLCARCDNNSRHIGELITLTTSPQQLHRYWQHNGWIATHVQTDETSTVFSLTRNQDCRQAIMLTRPDGIYLLFILQM